MEWKKTDQNSVFSSDEIFVILCISTFGKALFDFICYDLRSRIKNGGDLKKKRLLEKLWRSSSKIIMIGLETVTM